MDVLEQLLHVPGLEEGLDPLRVGLGIGEVERRILVAVDPDDDKVQIGFFFRPPQGHRDLHRVALDAVAAEGGGLELVCPLDELHPVEVLLGSCPPS